MGRGLGDTSGDAAASPDCFEAAIWESLRDRLGQKGIR